MKAEMAMEKAMVSANWRKRMPVVPGKNATGTKTATSTSEVAMTAPGDFFHGVGGGFGRAGLAFLQVALDVFNDDDHVVDDQPRRQSDAKKRQRVDGKAEQLYESERPDERNRSGDEVNDRRPPVAEENEDHQDDQQDRRTHRKNHVADGFADGIGGVEGDLIFHAGRKALGKAIEFGDAASMNIERVGGGELGDGDADRVTPVVVEVGGL